MAVLWSERAVKELGGEIRRLRSGDPTGLRGTLGSGLPELPVRDRSRMLVAKTDGSGITARSGATPGSGTVTIQTRASGGSITNKLDGTGSAITVTAYNLSTQSLPASSYTFIVKDAASRTWWAVWEDCP